MAANSLLTHQKLPLECGVDLLIGELKSWNSKIIRLMSILLKIFSLFLHIVRWDVIFAPR